MCGTVAFDPAANVLIFFVTLHQIIGRMPWHPHVTKGWLLILGRVALPWRVGWKPKITVTGKAAAETANRTYTRKVLPTSMK